ncbi:MAG: repeat containing protein [Flavipsychrobacter sp.]|nr:repeat containing protein [Flavipsychrobacter sp.]
MAKKYLFLIFCFCAAFASRSQTITTIAGDGAYGFFGDGGPATNARFQYIWYVAIGDANSLYFTDNSNHRIRKISGAGTISTFAGTGASSYSGDGGQATAATFIGTSGITVDGTGNVYFADVTNHRLRMINTSGIISTVAGTGTAGYGGDGGPATAALLNAPYGVLADAAGNVYIAEAGNHRVRKIDASGTISTVAGNGTSGFSGDGSAATAAQLSSPTDIAIDIQGNLYISEGLNNRVRRVNTAGIISTIAGTGTAGYSGDGGAATAANINQPLSLAVDGIGNVFISDQLNHRIRKVDASGLITTVAGTGIGAYSGDGGPATAANIKQTFGIRVDSAGDLYFSDWGNFRIRKISYGNRIPVFVSGSVDSIAVCQDSGPADISSLLRVNDADASQTLTWAILSGANHGMASVAYTAAATAGVVTPTGVTYTPSPGYAGMDTLIVRVDDGHSIDTITIYVRVKPAPPIGLITGTPVVCIGVPATMLNSVTGGTWHSSSSIATIDAAGTVNGLSEGVDTIFYITTAAGCSSKVSHVINIYATSVTITGVNAVCFDLVITLTGTPGGGTWAGTNGITTVSSTGDIYGVTPGVDTIIYSVTNPCGTFTTMKEVTVNAMIAPVVVISASPGPFILPGQSDTLYANIVSGAGIAYDYQWQVNGFDIPGATNNFYISDSFKNHDSVTCMVTNGPCAASSFGWMYIVYLNDGVDEVGNDMISIAPNPNDGIFVVEGWLATTEAEAVVEIADMVGRNLSKETVPLKNGVLKKRMRLDDDLPGGIYLLRITAGNRQKILRIAVGN